MSNRGHIICSPQNGRRLTAATEAVVVLDCMAISNWRFTTEKVSNTKTNNLNYLFLLLHIRLNLKVRVEKHLVAVYHEVLRRALVF